MNGEEKSLRDQIMAEIAAARNTHGGDWPINYFNNLLWMYVPGPANKCRDAWRGYLNFFRKTDSHGTDAYSDWSAKLKMLDDIERKMLEHGIDIEHFENAWRCWKDLDHPRSHPILEGLIEIILPVYVALREEGFTHQQLVG